jgi:hypothetical protein
VDEEDGVGSCHSAIWESLCEPSEFIGWGFGPDCAVFWDAHELLVVEVLSSVVITDDLDMFSLLLLSELHVSSMW